METERDSHILCGFSYIKISLLGESFMEPSDYNEVLLCNVLYFVRGTGQLAE
jgi:hypothetical protein